MAELADALVSGSSEAIHVGSSPFICTKIIGEGSTLSYDFYTHYTSNPWYLLANTLLRPQIKNKHNRSRKSEFESLLYK